MADTNLILAASISLIRAFAAVVDLPDNEVPLQVQDLRSYVVGSPGFGSPDSPTDVYCVHRSGAQYWVKEGAVRGYSSPRSYFDSYTGNSKSFQGTSLDTNELFQSAEGLLKRFQKRGDAFKSTVPIIHRTGKRNDVEIPFYRFEWRYTNSSPYSYAARIEIDGRSNQIVDFYLNADEFFDPPYASALAKRAGAEDLPKKSDSKPKVARRAPIPEREVVARDIITWLQFCRRLGIYSGTNGNVDTVDWSRCFRYTNVLRSTRTPIYQIRFLDGTCFEAVDGIVFSHFSADACYTGFWDQRPANEWKRFDGKVNQNWEELAKGFQDAAIRQLQLPEKQFSDTRRWRVFSTPDLGETGTVRTVVRWYKWPKVDKVRDLHSLPIVMSSEFDLSNGEVKWFEADPKILGWTEKTNH